MAKLRWNKLTRQGWNMSCGAAALSTLLTCHHERNFSEMAVTLTILKNSDPELVRKKGEEKPLSVEVKERMKKRAKRIMN